MHLRKLYRIIDQILIIYRGPSLIQVDPLYFEGDIEAEIDQIYLVT
jgi:hypothetical protein